MAFNGGYDGSNHYNIGIAASPDTNKWTLSGQNPVFSGSGGSNWDAGTVKDPHLLSAQSQLLLYYTGYNAAGTIGQSGVATPATSWNNTPWTRYSGNPVIPVGGGGAWDAYSIIFPFVVYDVNEKNPAQVYKAWYTGYASNGAQPYIGYAYASNPFGPFTKSASNPVLSPGVGGSLDALGVVAPTVVWSAGTWYLFYEGFQNASFPYGGPIMLATFTDPEGTYTKSGSNPIISPSSASQTLTAPTSSGSPVFTVASNAGFSVGEPVLINHTATSAVQQTYVLSKQSTTGITTTTNASISYTTSDTIASIYYNSVSPKSILNINGTWTQFGVGYQAFGFVSEWAVAWTASALTGPWTADYTRGALLSPHGAPGSWDPNSAENPSVVLL